MEELQELIVKLRGLNPDPEQFANLLRQEAQPLFQVVFNRGHATATSQHEQSLSGLRAQLDQANQKIRDKEKELEQLRAQTPDVALMRQEYEQRVEQLEADLKKARDEGRAALVNVLQERALSDLRALAARRGIDPEYADVLIYRHKISDRIVIRDDNGVDVLEAGKQIPIQADKPLEVLADWMYEQTPAAFRTSNADSGSGSRSGGAGGDAAGFYEGIRSGMRKEEAPRKSAAERMNLS